MQPYVHNTHIFGGNFYRNLVFFFYIVLPGKRYDVEIIFHNLLYIMVGNSVFLGFQRNLALRTNNSF